MSDRSDTGDERMGEAGDEGMNDTGAERTDARSAGTDDADGTARSSDREHGETATVDQETVSSDADVAESEPPTGGEDPTELAVQLELLAAENDRLRREYARAHQSKHTRTAIGLGALGLLALGGGVLFPAAQTVLFALGGTGLFVGVLTYYLTPERFVSATVGERIYDAQAATLATLAGELGLQETSLYVPLEDGSDGVRLFVPQHATYHVPSADELRSVLVLPDDERARGVAVRPTGEALFAEFLSTTVDEVGEAPGVLATQLTDALVESLEIAASATPEVDPDGKRVSVAIVDSAYGPVDRFDHPIASFLGTGMASGLAVPVEVTVTAGDDRADAVVTCTWSTGGESSRSEPSRSEPSRSET